MAGFGSAPGIIVGVGVGAAASAALEPALEIPKQEAWQRNANRILVPTTLAQLVAQGGIALDSARASALRDGYSHDKLDALVYLSQAVPGIGEATDLWRKGLLSSELYTHVLVKTGLDQRYVAPIVANKTAEVLGIGDIAYGVVRGILPAPSWVPVAPPATGDKVPRFPQVDLDPLTLAQMLGYDEDMLKLAVGRSGLSMAPVMAAQALFRQIIGPNDFLLAIAEGDLRTEWAEAVREVSRQILTSHDAAELQLRGYLTRDQRLTYTQAHGMADSESDLLYDLLGRSINVHQILIGERRGGKYMPSPATFAEQTAGIPAAFLAALERGNLRPEYYNLAYAARESYPSYFVIRPLVQSGAITEERATELFLGMGWPEDVARAAPAAFKGATGTATDPHVSKAQSQLWTQTHKSYLANEATDADATDRFNLLGIPAASQSQVLALWQSERSLIRKGLTAANIHKAYVKSDVNDATGLPWTRDEAIARLVELGYGQADAGQYLDIP